jgi:CubicO group peptidase (beta-lactamase class C family)
MSDLTQRLHDLDAYIQAEMDKWQVPGLAAAVLHDGEVIYEQGFGTRDLDNPQPVTPETLFAIGSCTKAFTVMGLGLLVDEGRLDWDKPIRHYLPQFRLHDPVASEQMTARDLVSHRSGLPRHDAAWYGSSRSRWELFAALPYLQPSQPFRYGYQYQNLMYMAAGCLIEAITGQTWEQFTQERIFNVLGMADSLFSVIDADKALNAARPHDRENGRMKRMPFRNIDAVGPAGSIHASLRDMAPWLRLHMNGGQHAGQPFITADQLKQMHQPLIAMTPPPPALDFVEIQHSTYGLGWAQQIYRGHLRIRHTGGIDGFISDVSFMPQQKLGVMVFNNGEDALSHSVAMHIYDRLLGLEPIDWRTRLQTAEEQIKIEALAQHEKLRAGRKADTTPTHPLTEFVGVYTHPGYGILEVSLGSDGDTLQAVYNGLIMRLLHLHYNVFETLHDLNYEERPPMPIVFALDLEGRVAHASIRLEPTPAVDEITFTRH